MFLNIITPCSRPQNLHKISESINIPRDNYRWIVVFDSDMLPDNKYIPENCEYYIHKNIESISGNSQRNFAIDMVEEGFVYFNDDDTIIHPNIWENIRDCDYDFISFSQQWKDGRLRLLGNNIEIGQIDSHNFLISLELIGDTRWILDKYDADGYFAKEIYNKALNLGLKIEFIPKVLSIYNCLR
jgi:hypothetical protein